MVLDQPTNFARGETTSSIASTDTTFDVANASTFADPSNGEYNLVMWDQTQHARPTASGASPEIVRVTGRDTTPDTLTVSRGQEGTAASAFPSGAALIHTQTAKTFGDIDSTFASFWDEQNQELTADINATNGDIDSLSTDENNNTEVWVTPGDDLQSRVDACPAGGTLKFEAGVHDIATMGTATITKPINLWWSSGSTERPSTSTDSIKGAWIDNTGSDSVAGPILHFDGSSLSDGLHNIRLHRPTIAHDDTGPAIRTDNAPMMTVEQPLMTGISAGERGFYMATSSWGITFEGGRIQDFNQPLVDESDGGLKSAKGTAFLGDNTSSSIGMILNEGWTLMNPDTAEAGIGYDVRGDQVTMFNPRSEVNDVGIRVGPNSIVSSKIDRYRCFGYDGNSTTSEDIQFDNSDNALLFAPTRLDDSDTGTDLLATSNAISPQFVLDRYFFKFSVIDVSGAFLPSVQGVGGMPQFNDTQRSDITSPVQGMAIWNTTDGLPNYYNGSGWVLPDGTST